MDKILYQIKIGLRKFLVQNLLLISPTGSVSKNQEKRFTALQKEFSNKKVKEYGYDPVNRLKRSTTRIQELLSIIPSFKDKQTNLKILEVGCGEGQVGLLLENISKEVHLHDLEDWRAPEAKGLPFIQADLGQALSIPDNEFDVIFSYNSWEHVPDPALATQELIRICKPSGYIFLSFGPLFNSPNGLHAYRSMYMPYPQFLFTEDFINHQLKSLGIDDLGEKRDELQPLNRWSLQQFEALFQDLKDQVDIKLWTTGNNYRGLNTILQYRSLFANTKLSLKELTTQNIKVLMQKKQ